MQITLSCSPVPSPAPPSSSPGPVEGHRYRRPLLPPSLFLDQFCSFWSQSRPSPVPPDSVWRRLPPMLHRPTSVQRRPPPVPPESIRRHPPLVSPDSVHAVPLGILIVSLPSFFDFVLLPLLFSNCLHYYPICPYFSLKIGANMQILETMVQQFDNSRGTMQKLEKIRDN